jgi:hypothetical protein
MSTPSAARHPEGTETTPPLGFVLSTDRLITVRFMPLPAFDAVVDKFASSQDAPKSSLEVFTLLCEEIVDRVAELAVALEVEPGQEPVARATGGTLRGLEDSNSRRCRSQAAVSIRDLAYARRGEKAGRRGRGRGR